MWAMLSFYTATLKNLLNSSKAVIKVLPHMIVCVSRVINYLLKSKHREDVVKR